MIRGFIALSIFLLGQLPLLAEPETFLVAVSARTNSGTGVYLTDTSGVQLIVISGDHSSALDPTWTPKGDGLAYSAFEKGLERIYLRKIEASDVRSFSGSSSSEPSFTEDGRKALFSAPGQRSGDRFLYYVGGGGQGGAAMIARDWADRSPYPTKNSANYIFLSNRAPSLMINNQARIGVALYIQPLRSTGDRPPNPSQLTLLNPCGLKNEELGRHLKLPNSPISPIAEETLLESGLCGYECQSCLVNLVNGDSRPISSEPELAISDPSWAPDGKRIVFVNALNDSLGVINSDGSNLTILQTPGVTKLRTPRFTPDGSRLIFLGEGAGSTNLYIHDLSSARALLREAKVDGAPIEILSFAISPTPGDRESLKLVERWKLVAPGEEVVPF